MQQLLVEPVAADTVAERGHQIFDRPANCRPSHRTVARLEVGQPLEQAFDLVRDGENGTLIDPGDAEGFADALEAYARDPVVRSRHGAAGLAYAETQDWDRINSVVLKTYQRVIERRERYARLTGRRTI